MQIKAKHDILASMIDAYDPRKSAAQSLAAEREITAPTNLFATFIINHGEQLAAYGGLSKEFRRTEKAWRQAFVPITHRIETDARQAANLNSKKIKELINGYTRLAFEISTPSEIEAGESDTDKLKRDILEGSIGLANVISQRGRSLGLDAGRADATRAIYDRAGYGVERLTGTWSVDIAEFNADYNDAIAITARDLDQSQADLVSDTTDFMLSSYGALVDMASFLSNPKSVPFRAQIAPFLRDFIASDTEWRRKGSIGVTGTIREQWQQRTRSNFEPVLFERFWQDALKSGKATEIIEWVPFSVRLAKSQRDEEAGQQLSSHDVRVAISRISMNEWPRSLRNDYLSFAQLDPAKLMEEIRVKLLQAFPKISEKSAYVVKQEGSAPKKVKTHGVANVPDDSRENGNGQEAEKDALSLALLKTNAVSGSDTHYVVSIDAGAQDSEIRRLCSVGKTPQMRADLVRVIEAIKDPLIAYGPAVHKLKGKTVTIGKTKQTLRRVDPKRLRGISFEDPATNKARVVFVIFDDMLMISGVYTTHEDYETAFSIAKVS